MKLVDELKALPPAWWGAIAGAAAAGAALVPEHRLLAGIAAGGLVFYIARRATQPCCAACSSSPSSSSVQQEQVTQQAPLAMRALDTEAGDLFADNGTAITTSGAAAGGDLFPDSSSLVEGGGCVGCAPAIMTAPAPDSFNAKSQEPVFSLSGFVAPSPIGTTAPTYSKTSLLGARDRAA